MTVTQANVSRRAMLKHGAVAGGLVWSVPLLQAVSMTPAHAATTSAPAHVKGTKLSTSSTTSTSAQNAALPRTGADVAPVLAVGAGAVAVGAAALVAARQLTSPTEDSDVQRS